MIKFHVKDDIQKTVLCKKAILWEQLKWHRGFKRTWIILNSAIMHINKAIKSNPSNSNIQHTRNHSSSSSFLLLLNSVHLLEWVYFLVCEELNTLRSSFRAPPVCALCRQVNPVHRGFALRISSAYPAGAFFSLSL